MRTFKFAAVLALVAVAGFVAGIYVSVYRLKADTATWFYMDHPAQILNMPSWQEPGGNSVNSTVGGGSGTAFAPAYVTGEYAILGSGPLGPVYADLATYKHATCTTWELDITTPWDKHRRFARNSIELRNECRPILAKWDREAKR